MQKKTHFLREKFGMDEFWYYFCRPFRSESEEKIKG